MTAHEVDADWEDFTAWFTLTLSPIDVPEGSRFARRNESVAAVRMSPPSTDIGGEWVGKALVMLEREDGTCIVTLPGKHRFWRAGGDSPWDWLGG